MNHNECDYSPGRINRLEEIATENRERIIAIEETQKAMAVNIAETAAEKAVVKMFSKLDIDVNNAGDIRQFKENLNFVSIAHSTAKATVWSFFITVAGFVVSAIWIAIRDHFK